VQAALAVNIGLIAVALVLAVFGPRQDAAGAAAGSAAGSATGATSAATSGASSAPVPAARA
jgi:hypothetical protein